MLKAYYDQRLLGYHNFGQLLSFFNFDCFVLWGIFCVTWDVYTCYHFIILWVNQFVVIMLLRNKKHFEREQLKCGLKFCWVEYSTFINNTRAFKDSRYIKDVSRNSKYHWLNGKVIALKYERHSNSLITGILILM